MAESEKKMQIVQEENDKMKFNYDILKEHEMNMIKDVEGKKSKEIQFFEKTLADQQNLVKEAFGKEKEYEGQIFQFKEEIRKLMFEHEKSTEDRKLMAQQIEKLGNRLEKEEDDRNNALKQLEIQENTAMELK